ncbi:hypothetical protein EYF80_025825 [Liparis tanakae]|uniref:Uncharacterized protein n=1 Tax=Liparis tanakae TaxID=230148 RepID=A0A4Z2HG93_9TELE|nr:hypothetical protein EYF80_025825 [Liparis tanakae]
MSCQDRMGVFSSSPTTMPGPWVGGPPMNSMTRAPVLGYQADGDGQRHAGGAEWPLALRHGPRVPLKLPEQVSQIHVDSVHGLQEPVFKHKQTLEQESRGGIVLTSGNYHHPCKTNSRYPANNQEFPRCFKTDLDLFGGEVLGAPEHVALGDPLTAELVDLHHASESDEADQGVGRQQAEGHLEGLLQGLEVLFLQTCVHHSGLSTALQLARLHRTGSYWTGGRSGLSLSGVKRQETGTTSLVASRRLEGQRFQLNLTPSRSSFCWMNSW